ncbi:MAG TPA: EAL domain-containing response regulator [Usitatibacter sp.]|nr:EAL domain-containing response regulator [Usitatibacter sp.]
MNGAGDVVRVLLIEDSVDDALLLGEQLRTLAARVEVHRVENEPQLVAALGEGGWHLVVSDYRLPRFSGMEALRIVREHNADLPFIMVSGEIAEAAAVAAMQAGASDYVMKGSLARLQPALQRELARRPARKLVALEPGLRRAVARGEFEVHYQPQVDLRDGSIPSVEALLRWRSPDRGMVMPADFVPALEGCGLIHEVGRWILRQAADDRRRWLAMGLEAPRIAVNTSVVQIRAYEFVDVVRQSLGGVGASGIDLEITESVLMDDLGACVHKLAALRDLGLRIVIDDFGVGHSCLAYLARLPAQALKIDRSFVASMLDETPVAKLVASVIGMARELRLDLVAEGVETEAQLGALRAMDCRYVQGYLLGRPLPFDETARLLRPGLATEGLPIAL